MSPMGYLYAFLAGSAFVVVVLVVVDDWRRNRKARENIKRDLGGKR